MTKDNKNRDPDFNEFWDELIARSNAAKENTGKVAREFKNLGVLQATVKKEQPHSVAVESPFVPSLGDISSVRKLLFWCGLFVITALLVAAVYFFLFCPNCAAGPSRHSYIRDGRLTAPGTGGQQQTLREMAPFICPTGSVFSQELKSCECLDGNYWNTTSTSCESCTNFNASSTPNASSTAIPSACLPKTSGENISKDSIKAGVVNGTSQ
jgi:hypothetical protein